MIELDDPTVTMTCAELVSLVDSYRHLVDCLLSCGVPHEGTDRAVGDYSEARGPDDHGPKILDAIHEAWQQMHHAEWAALSPKVIVRSGE